LKASGLIVSTFDKAAETEHTVAVLALIEPPKLHTPNKQYLFYSICQLNGQGIKLINDHIRTASNTNQSKTTAKYFVNFYALAVPGGSQNLAITRHFHAL